MHIGQGIKIGFTIIGTMIGAGFASGREIWEFFSSYGESSKYGILLAIGLFGVCTYTIMYIGQHVQALHYRQILEEIMGKRFASFFDVVILFYLFSVSVVMFAGSGATFTQWNMPYVAGVLVMAVLVYIVLLFDSKGLMSVNTVIIPVLGTVLVYVCLRFLWGGGAEGVYRPDQLQQSVWPSAVVYSGLNVLPLLAVLSTLRSEIKSFADAFLATMISTLGLGLVALLLNEALLQAGKEVFLYEIPLFAFLELYPIGMIALVSIILWLAIYTTAVSCLHGIVFRIAQNSKLSRPVVSLLLLLAMMPLSLLGFSVLIKFLYPLYGMINLFVLSLLILYPLSKRR